MINSILIILLKDDPMSGLFGLIGILVIGLIFLIFNATGNGIIYVVGKAVQLKNRIELTGDVIMRYASYLKNFTYYKKLSPDDQKKFIIRLAEFMHSKEFRGADGLDVTEEMKVMISASATQLLFGLDAHCLNFFNVIRVFPGIFYSQLMRVHMKGGTTRGGVIMLSWKDFQEGYKNDSDKLNLGLHELAHALKIEATSGDDYGRNLEDGFARWDEATKETMEKVGRGEIPFLRKYGGTNSQEFWAVCVEHFFEAPREFKEQLPTVYHYLTLLLKQDPSESSFASSTAIELPYPITTSPEEKIILPPPRTAPFPSFGNEILTGACFVLAIPIFSGLYSLTEFALVSTTSIWMTVLAFSLVGIIIFYRGWRSGEKKWHQYLIQSFVLCGMMGTLLLYIINHQTATIGKPEVYNIIGAKENYEPDGRTGFPVDRTLILEGHAYEEFPDILKVKYVPEKDQVVLEIGKGIFGIRFRVSRSFKYSNE